MRKRLNLFKQEKNTTKCLELLRWLSGSEAKEFYPPELKPNYISVLQEQYDLLEPQESAQISKDIETGRLRLSSATESLERLVERVEVQNYSRELTGILRELVEIKPGKYLELYSNRLLRIVLSDFCSSEQIRQEYSNELLSLIDCAAVDCIKYNINYDAVAVETKHPFSGPRNVLNRLKEAEDDLSYDVVLKLYDQLEITCKKWKRAFNCDTTAYMTVALKMKLKALICLNYSEDALELAAKFSDEDLLDDSLFDSILTVFENGTLLSRAISLIELKLVHVDPGHPGLILRLIDDLIELNRFNEASEYIEAVREAYEPSSLDPVTRACISFVSGLCAWHIGDRASKSTLNDLLTAAKENPIESKYFTWIGKYYLRIENDQSRALKCFSKALSLNPSCLQAALLFSEISLLTEEGNNSVCELLKPFTMQSIQARNRRLFYYYGVVLFRSGDFLDACVAFQSALKGSSHQESSSSSSSDPRVSDENCLQWLGEAYLRSNRLGSAGKTFTRLINLNSSDSVAITGLAAVHLKSSNPIEAMDCLDSISETGNIPLKIKLDKSQAALDLARFYLRQGRFISAMKSVLRSLSHLKENICAESLRMTADAFILAESFKEIQEFPQEHFLANTEYIESLVYNTGLSEIYSKLTDCSSDDFRAISCKFALGAISEAFKQPNKHCLSVYWLQLSASLSRIEDLKEFAISAAENSIKSADSSSILRSQAHHLQALIYSHSVKTRRQSQHHFICALKSHETPQIWTDLGRFYLDSGDLELARDSFKRALSVDQEDLVAAFELARSNGTVEGNESAKQVALRAFTTQPVHFTEDFAWALIDSDASVSIKQYVKVFLKRRFPNNPKLKNFVYNGEDTPPTIFATKFELLNYLNSLEIESDPKMWLSPFAADFDCEFLLKRPENEVTQSGWRAVVEGLLPTVKERTKIELEELLK